MRISFKAAAPEGDALAVGVLPGRRLTPTAAALDERIGGALRRALGSGRFRGEPDQVVELLAPRGFPGPRILAVGIGRPEKLDGPGCEALGGRIIGQLEACGEQSAAVALDMPASRAESPAAAEAAAHLALGARLRAYRFERYRTRRRPEDPSPVRRLTIVTPAAREARALFARLGAVACGVELARDLVNEPANVMHLQSFVERAQALAGLGLEVQALGKRQLRAAGLGALLAVARGSAHEPRLLVVRWRGARGERGRPFAFIGKGVTFDSGGIDVKPAKGMEEMKGDMAGAAAVLGLMRSLALRRAAIDVVAVMPLVENMPSGAAFRPGDVVTACTGDTIEIVDTDAEGRLILLDAIAWTVKRFRPRLLVDLATLTSSVIRALGRVHAGLFANDDDLADALVAAGRATGERLWRLPLDPDYDANLKSEIADIRQCAPDDASADAVHGAQLLQRFAGGAPWAHLDIAGKEFAPKERPTQPKGATGFGVRLLDRFVAGLEAGPAKRPNGSDGPASRP